MVMGTAEETLISVNMENVETTMMKFFVDYVAE